MLGPGIKTGRSLVGGRRVASFRQKEYGLAEQLATSACCDGGVWRERLVQEKEKEMMLLGDIWWSEMDR